MSLSLYMLAFLQVCYVGKSRIYAAFEPIIGLINFRSQILIILFDSIPIFSPNNPNTPNNHHNLNPSNPNSPAFSSAIYGKPASPAVSLIVPRNNFSP